MFEVLEHILDPESVLDRIKNWLSPEGTFIGSTPNKWVYRARMRLRGEQPEPDHCSEMTYKEISSLLKSKFSHVRLLGALPMGQLIVKSPLLAVVLPSISELLCKRLVIGKAFFSGTIYWFCRK